MNEPQTPEPLGPGDTVSAPPKATQTPEQVIAGVNFKHSDTMQSIDGVMHIACTGCDWVGPEFRLELHELSGEVSKRFHRAFCAHQAAEVMAALGLREEWTAGGADIDGPWIAQLNDYSRDEAEEYVDKHGGHLERRYVTEWEEVPADGD